ncbi:MAG TPA: MFS transporter [Longimicrobium sp.]|uniref:MFS transporter n=1 Tax=Longimicrobium sp. TaxID=2029185 RepID=UPI002ED7767A
MLWLIVFSVSSQFLVIAPLLPRMVEELRVPAASLSVLVSGYAFAVGVVAVVMGPVSDRVGRRRMLLAGTAVMAVALALHGLARGFPTLIAVRVLAGAGGGVLTGAAAAYVGDYFPYERRGWALGWVATGMAAGQILGVPAGALIADRAGFRIAFLVFGATMALACAAVWGWLPQPQVERSTDRASLAGGLRHYGALLARPGVRPAAAAYLCVFVGTALYTVYLPTWLEASRGITPAQVAVVFVAGGVATLLAGPRTGRLSDRVGRRVVVIFASLGVALLMALTPWVVTGVWSASAVFFLLMTLIAARSGALDALLTEIVPDTQRGSMMSLMMATGQIGFGAGGALTGAVYAAIGYEGNATLAAGAAIALAMIAWRLLPEPDSASDGEPSPASR